MGNSRFESLTGFRAIAVTMVFIYHNRKYWRNEINIDLLRFINEFHLGVSFFFVLSGFLISYRYSDSPLKNKHEYLKYISIRLARVLPLYWLILTAYYVDPDFGNLKFDWMTYSLIHGFSEIQNLKGIAQAWSLNVEINFYFLAPFLFYVLEKSKIWLFFTIFALLSLTYCIGQLWDYIDGNPFNFLYPFKFILNSTFPGRSLDFVYGMLLAKLLKDKKTNFLNLKFKTFFGSLGVLLTIFLIGQFQTNIYSHGNEKLGGLVLQIFVLPFFISITLLGLILERTILQKFLSNKVLVLLGNASFSFYLIHISYVNLRLKDIILMADRNFILLWVISIIIYLFFEKPIYEKIKKMVYKIS